MDKKLTWYNLREAEVMDVMRKGRDAKVSDYKTLDQKTIDSINDNFEKKLLPEIKGMYEDKLGLMSKDQFKYLYRKTMDEIENPSWYNLNAAGEALKAKEAKQYLKLDEDFSSNKDEMKEWNELKLTAEQARNAEKKLQGTLETAIKNGADKEVTSKIFDAWKVQNEKAEKFEEALYKKGKPDIMQNFASKQKENVQKGMLMVSDKVDGLNKDMKQGKIETKGLFTQKIGEVNMEVTNMYNQAQQEISGKLRDAFGTKDLSAFYKVDPERLNGWVKAMDVSEEYMNKTLSANSLVNETRLEVIGKVLDNANDQKKELIDAYKKELETVKRRVDYKTNKINSSSLGENNKKFVGIKLSMDTNKKLELAKKELDKKIDEIDSDTMKQVSRINRSAIKLDKVNRFARNITKPIVMLGRGVAKIASVPFKIANKVIDKIKEKHNEKSMSILSGNSKKAPEMAKDAMEQQDKQR